MAIVPLGKTRWDSSIIALGPHSSFRGNAVDNDIRVEDKSGLTDLGGQSHWDINDVKAKGISHSNFIVDLCMP